MIADGQKSPRGVEMTGQMDMRPTGLGTPVSYLTISLACVLELLLWVAACVTMYWVVPESVGLMGSAGIELPRSMIRVIGLTDLGVRYVWITIPLILAMIVVPKVMARSQPSSVPLLFMFMIGVFAPITFFIFGTGLPKILELGLWP